MADTINLVVIKFMRTMFRKKKITNDEAEFMDDIQNSLLTQTTPGSRAVLYIIVLIMLTGFFWSYLSRVEEITKGEAKIISKSREQEIQSLEGGILEELYVKEGDIVEQGQALLKIDATRASASYNEINKKVIGLKATIARLRAEAFDIPLEFDDQVRNEAKAVELETKAYNSRRKALQDSTHALEQSYRLSISEIRLAEPLAAKGLLSEVELLRMRRAANDIQSQIVERKNRFRAEANAELTKLELELSQASQNLIGREDVVKRTTINAPVRGTVKNIRFNTKGGVIQPGESILEIIPLEEQLLVEAKIKPSDVAFLHPGLSATVKITAYDYSIYGGLKGSVEFISPDTLKEEDPTRAKNTDSTYYRVVVLTDKSYLNAGSKELPIIPGMLATVEIKTGEKRIIDYLLKPIYKAREAFRER
nr:HlyD family type I secretion periplasmic adaptor subunit [Enterobacter bugandensis]